MVFAAMNEHVLAARRLTNESAELSSDAYPGVSTFSKHRDRTEYRNQISTCSGMFGIKTSLLARKLKKRDKSDRSTNRASQSYRVSMGSMNETAQHLSDYRYPAREEGRSATLNVPHPPVMRLDL